MVKESLSLLVQCSNNMGSNGVGKLKKTSGWGRLNKYEFLPFLFFFPIFVRIV